MANTFKVKLSRNVGTTLTRVGAYTVPAATQTTVIGLNLANTTASPVTADITLNDGGNDTYIVKGVEILPGTSVIAAGGEQKLVLQAGEGVFVKSSALASVDVVMSVLEIS